jgi:hypothetical protein
MGAIEAVQQVQTQTWARTLAVGCNKSRESREKHEQADQVLIQSTSGTLSRVTSSVETEVYPELEPRTITIKPSTSQTFLSRA